VVERVFLLKNETVTESVAALIKAVTEIVAPVAVPVSASTNVVDDERNVVAPLVTVVVTPDTAADEGIAEITPNPKAATATSAMRLKFVVVDIYFLSLVATRNFLVAASR